MGNPFPRGLVVDININDFQRYSGPCRLYQYLNFKIIPVPAQDEFFQDKERVKP